MNESSEHQQSTKRLGFSYLLFILGLNTLFLCIAVIGTALGNLAFVPLALRLLVGITCFGFTPGFLLFSLFQTRHSDETDRDPVTMFLVVVSLSFSCNLLFNILLFVTNSAFLYLKNVYIGFQLLLYFVIIFRLWKAPASFPHLRQKLPLSLSPVTIILAGALLTTISVIYLNGSPTTNPEELIVLRKLAENPAVRYNNISVSAGQPSTYLFTPFQVFIVGASLVAGIDVTLGYSLLWVFTTFISLLCISKLVGIFANSQVAFLSALALGVIVVFFEPNSVIYQLGFFAPYPNRYGFSGGVLLPLNLLMFFLILKAKRISPLIVGLLIYLTVELSFVHARETIFLLGCVVIATLVLLRDVSKYRGLLLRMGGIILITLLVLIFYKYANLKLAPDLSDYVERLSADSRQVLVQSVSQQGLLPVIFSDSSFAIHVTGQQSASTITVALPSYQELIIDNFNKGNPHTSRLILPFCLLLLIPYVLLSRSRVELIIAACVTGFCILSLSSFLKLFLSVLVGNPEALLTYGIIYLLSYCVFAHMLALTAAFLTRQLSKLKPPYVLLIMVGMVAVVVLMFDGPFSVTWLKVAFTNLFTLQFAAALHLVTATVIAIRLFTSRMPVFNDSEIGKTPEKVGHAPALFSQLMSGPGLQAGLALILPIVILSPVILNSAVWTNNPFVVSTTISDFTGNFDQDYDLLKSTSKLTPAEYPLTVINFLRHAVSPGQTVLARDSYSVIVTTTHFTEVLTKQGQVSSSQIVNQHFLEKYGKPKLSIMDFLKPDYNFRMLRGLLSDFHVNLVLVDPSEINTVQAAWDENQALQVFLKPIYSDGEYLIYEVQKTIAI